jgi:hypothetical protein
MITIVTLFCDKDVKYLERYLGYYNKLTFDRELILVDNRVNDTSIIPVSAVSKHENLGCVAGRLYGASFAKGDYIWFNDVDDEPLDLPVSLLKSIADNNPDIVDYFIETLRADKFIDFQNKPSKSLYSILSTVWNSLFKREIIEKIAPHIRDIHIVYGEEHLFDFFAAHYADSLLSTNVPFYKYNVDIAECSNVTPTLEQFYRIYCCPNAFRIMKEFDPALYDALHYESVRKHFNESITRKYDNVKKTNPDMPSIVNYIFGD